jgi:riboflavin synthase
MFSGIVETIGVILQAEFIQNCLHVTLRPQMTFDDLNLGDSVAVNGVCLTVTAFDADKFNVVIVPETLRLTNLATLEVGATVNLERSVKVNVRIGGHCVQGHVDTHAAITALTPDGGAALIATIQAAPALTKYIVKKGYVAIDGMSITVMDVSESFFTVTFIPHTQAVTIVNQYRVGTPVNIEVDIMGKYVEKLLGAYSLCNPI